MKENQCIRKKERENCEFLSIIFLTNRLSLLRVQPGSVKQAVGCCFFFLVLAGLAVFKAKSLVSLLIQNDAVVHFMCVSWLSGYSWHFFSRCSCLRSIFIHLHRSYCYFSLIFKQRGFCEMFAALLSIPGRCVSSLAAPLAQHPSWRGNGGSVLAGGRECLLHFVCSHDDTCDDVSHFISDRNHLLISGEADYCG